MLAQVYLKKVKGFSGRRPRTLVLWMPPPSGIKKTSWGHWKLRFDSVGNCSSFLATTSETGWGQVGLAGTHREPHGPFPRVTAATPVPGTHRRRIRSTASIAVTATRLSISNFNPIALPNLMTWPLWLR